MELSKQVKLLIKTYKIFPSKKLGQNFLIKETALSFIKDSISPEQSKKYIEIGPGFLFLTEKVSPYVKEIFAIEKDKRFIPFYEEHTIENVKIIINDALKIKFDEFDADELFGNIPYNISTDLILKIIESKKIKRAVLLLQKEFAMRILSDVGGKNYSSITVLIDFFFDKKFLKTFPPHFFYPKPGVSSTLIELRKKKLNEEIDQELFFEIVRSAFAQRRKKIVNTLSTRFDREKVQKALKLSGIAFNRRAETLTLNDYKNLYEFLKNS